ncbi:MAG: hypothetical protein AAF571_00385 [Verrucomicrobiota bacterium]
MKFLTLGLLVWGFSSYIPASSYAQSQEVKSAQAAYVKFVGVARSARSMKTLLPYLSASEVSRYEQSMSWVSSTSEKTAKSKKKLARWKDISNRYVRVIKGVKNKKGVILTLNVQKMNKSGRYAAPKSGVKYDEATIQLVMEKGRWKIDKYNDTVQYTRL